MGFEAVAAGPLVRSSYYAEQTLERAAAVRGWMSGRTVALGGTLAAGGAAGGADDRRDAAGPGFDVLVLISLVIVGDGRLRRARRAVQSAGGVRLADAADG